MARALLLALTCAAAASAARYVDYSGVKMPAYGAGAGDYEALREPAAAPPSDDYRGHSHDAPASPDYKYEEEPPIKTEKPAKDSDEPEVWRKPGRKQRGLNRPPLDSAADAARKYDRDDEDVPKFRTSHRYPKHRSRLKDVPSDDEPARRVAKYSRDRKDDVSDIDSKDYFHVDKDDFPDDKSKEFEEEVKFVNEAINRRGSRRKPRERFVKRKNSDLDIANDDEELDEHMKSDEAEMGPTRPPDPRTHGPHAPRGHNFERFRPPPDDDEDELTKVQAVGKPKHKSFHDYEDYYDDMKRVNSIKSKLPSLLRRTTEPAPAPTPTNYLDMLWTSYRRMLPPVRTEEQEPVDSTPRVPSPRPKTLTPTPTTTTMSSATRRKRTTTPFPTTTTVSTTTSNDTALSLAEKSRLSILKKDQRKKGQHVDAPTQKPPVLLQVSQYVPTVVMVEPPTSMHPWLRIRELSDDSPERLEKVKKLMRHKLVAEAKSIHDLTNNWDELVCDYIDVALVDGEARSAAPAADAARSCCFLHVWLILHVYLFV